MTTEDRITRLEGQLRELEEQHDELRQQLAEAEREQWQGYVDQLEIQLHLAAMDGNDRIQELMDRLRGTWARVRHELDSRPATGSDVRATLRSGLHDAVRDVRQALLESRQKIHS